MTASLVTLSRPAWAMALTAVKVAGNPDPTCWLVSTRTSGLRGSAWAYSGYVGAGLHRGASSAGGSAFGLKI